MSHYQLQITFKSDATLGSGDGLPGMIDREISRDRFGVPYLKGRTIKGLLSEEADNILFALKQSSFDTGDLDKARKELFGNPGSSLDEIAKMHYGRATLPENIRSSIVAAVNGDQRVSANDIFESLTSIRRQTAIEDGFLGPEGEFDETAKVGTPAKGSLRAMRVLLRETVLVCDLYSDEQLSDLEFGLLSAAIKAWRRAGTGRNRGRGRLQASILDMDQDGREVLASGIEHFSAYIQGEGNN